MGDKKSSDFLWKIALAGDSFVGKTTIRKRAMGEHFAEEYISTVGADFSSYKLKLGDLIIGFQVWDLAGQDKYKYIRSSFYGGATGCFLVYDVTNPKSLKSLSSWVDEAIRYSNGTIEIFIICANKIDLIGRREISRETGLKYTQALRESSGLQCEYIETSALTGENIDVAFDMMAKCLLEREGISPAKLQEAAISSSEVQESSIKELPPSPTEIKPVAKQPQTTQVIETIPSVKPSIVKEDETTSQTDRLIAEVMAVLEETNEIIIGKEKTKLGERTITIPKTDAEKTLPKVEAEPKISSKLENVLKQINQKLDSLTDRLKDLEEEISSVKSTEQVSETPLEEKATLPKEPKETTEEQDELDLLAQLPLPSEIPEEVTEEPHKKKRTIEERTQEKKEAKEVPEKEEEKTPQTAMPEPKILSETMAKRLQDEEDATLEELLETSPIQTEPVQPLSETLETKEQIPEQKLTPKKEQRELDASIEELEDLPDDELIDIPNEEPLIPLSDDNEDEVIEDKSVLGTELSSALISELKDLSDEEEAPEGSEEQLITKPLQVEQMKEKHLCPICGEEMKFIRQYKRFYCVKCGRYLI